LPDIDFRRTPVTILLAIAIIALEVVSTLDPGRRDYYYFDAHLGIWPTLWDGQLWQPFTTSLLHGNLLHAGFNLWWLWIFGQVLEPRLGSMRFLAICVLLSYASMLPQFVVIPGPAVGFSGVVYGLFGMVWMGRRWERSLYAICDAGTVRLMLIWFVLCIVLTETGAMPVANVAHGAGLLFGVLYGLALFDRRNRWRWRGLAILATLLVLVPLIACPGNSAYEEMRHIQRQRALLEAREKIVPNAGGRAQPAASRPAGPVEK
jgi:membrane associated rhomboid family serine protease